MDEKLDKLLVETFPLLYKDRNAPMQQTCLCWGFSCGNGWFKLIWDLSVKLEPIIQDFLDKNPNLDCQCGHEWGKHRPLGNCSEYWRVPKYFLEWSRKFSRGGWYAPSENKIVKTLQLFWWRKIRWPLNRWSYSFPRRILWSITENTPLYAIEHCSHCKGYYPDHPRASQVKEKFGGLCFYMSGYLPEMDELIQEAEKKSRTICEDCGQEGRHVTKGGSPFGWMATLCPDCATKDGYAIPEGSEEDEDENEETNGN